MKGIKYLMHTNKVDNNLSIKAGLISEINIADMINFRVL
jgi:hypothetical protein